MSYTALYRKFRPDNFDDVKGQDHIVTTLTNQIKANRIGHAYLFCGTRGTGKTTVAKILAKAVNCEHPVNGSPCNECAMCKAIQAGTAMNVIEIDAASNNGVDNIREIREEVAYRPTEGKYKVYIIDEVHMLSTGAFNALLKTLEEPPSYVIFILATTEKHKILPTILSRCQIYDFERMTTNDIINHLKKVAEKEGITYEDEALNIIAEKADGGMRDALSVFDQAASFCQGNITYAKVTEDLNVLDTDNYFNIVDLCLQNKVSDAMLLLNSIIAKGFAGGHFINGLASHIRNVLMAKDVQTLPLLEVSQKQRQKYEEQAKKCPTTFLYQALKLLNQCDINYRQSSNKRLLVEITLIQIAQITQPDDTPAGVGRSPKRLKSLFKKLAPAMGGETNQRVVSSETGKVSPVNASHSQLSSTPKKKDTGVQINPNTQPTRPRLKISDLGISFGSLRSTSTKNITQAEAQQQTTSASTTFSNEELRIQWNVMCNRMPPEKIGLSQRMKNLLPQITTFPQVEVVIENDILLKQLQDIKGKIQATLRMLLQNNNLLLPLRLAEAQEVTKIYSKREIFELLKKENPQLDKLCHNLGLELS